MKLMVYYFWKYSNFLRKCHVSMVLILYQKSGWSYKDSWKFLGLSFLQKKNKVVLTTDFWLTRKLSLYMTVLEALHNLVLILRVKYCLDLFPLHLWTSCIYLSLDNVNLEIGTYTKRKHRRRERKTNIKTI